MIKVIILSIEKKSGISGINTVLSNLFPLLKKKIDVKRKFYLGAYFIIKKTPFHPFVKLLLIGFLTFLKLLFDKDIWKCEIINAHGIDSWLPTIWICKIFRKKSLITFHETYEYTKEHWFCGGGKFAQWLWNYGLKNGDYFVDISNTLKRENAFYIPNGVNLEKFRSKDFRKKEKNILYVGRLSPQKGIEYFIKASQIIKKELKENIKFIVITNSSVKKAKKYADLLERNGIKIYENVSSDKIVKFYQESYILIHSPISEAFGLVLVESMACGTPIIASRVGVIPSVVKDGSVGFLVPTGNPQAIAERALMILNNEELREKMSKNCLEWVKQFSWENVADKYIEVYKKILKE